VKLLLATTNQGKIREYKHLLKDAPFELVMVEDLSIEKEPEETGTTLEENAILKARFYFEKSGIVTLADDAGLEIDALNGEPGVRSRRWPGYEATDEELVKYAMEQMRNVPEGKRTARFRAVCAITKNGKDVRVFEGVQEGIIAKKPHYPIIAGYPYRSVFCHGTTGRFLSEIDLTENDSHAHRKEVFDKALPFLLEIAQGQ
jgi:XTP/dITP diphosphohydrolase